VELAGGVALLLGIKPRIVALLLVPLLLGTIVMVHGHNGFFFNNLKGGWEYPAVWTVLLIVQALIGDGFAVVAPTRLPHRDR
jgi:putative oxidoreductase